MMYAVSIEFKDASCYIMGFVHANSIQEAAKKLNIDFGENLSDCPHGQFFSFPKETPPDVKCINIDEIEEISSAEEFLQKNIALYQGH